MKNLHLLLIFVLLFSCKTKDDSKETITRLVTEWQGKEILFPDSPIFTLYGKDTVDYSIPQSTYKVLVYVDSAGCIDCKLQLQKWHQLIEYTNSISNGEISFLFFFHPKDYKELCQLFKRDLFDIPTCIDFEDNLNKLNNFPNLEQFHTLLLDKDNKVLVIGNPTHSVEIKDLFMKQIAETYDTVNEKEDINTVAEVTPIKADLGVLTVGESKKQTFELKNVGDKPLVIIHSSTTCGCASVKFEKRPIKPNETTVVEVTMKPQENGFFNEIIMLKCNTTHPVKLRIKGRTA